MSDAVRYTIALVATSAAVCVVFLNRPDRRPGNLAPIQLITALGAWSLIAVNVVLVGLAFARESLPLAIAPFATLISAAVHFASGATPRDTSRSVPAQFEVALAEIRSFLGGASRLGFNEIDAVLVAGGPSIGVAVPAFGRVVVRVHESVASWIERHRRSGASAAAIGSFIRFAVLHELAHILNGDHRTYRFARSVLLAHLWWFVSLFAIPLTVAGGDARDVFTILCASAFVAIMVAAQSLIARRFIAERELLADWRAIQCLPADDASRLLRRRGPVRAGRRGPTEIEKLMIDLKAHARQDEGRRWLAPIMRLLWPEGDSIHQRTERLAGDRAGAAPRPVRWAALSGLQCGVLATSVLMGAVLAASPLQVAMPYQVWVIAMAWFGGASGTYCVLRADPARMSLDPAARTRYRVVTGLTFFVTWLLAVFATDVFAALLRIPGWILALSSVTAAMIPPVVIVCCSWLLDLLSDGLGGSTFRLAPRGPWAFTVPSIAAILFVLGPVNVVVSQQLGLGSFAKGAWVAVMLCALGACVLSTGLARSSNAVLRAAAPVAVLDANSPVYAYRLFWWEFHVDLSRCSVLRAGSTAGAFQIAALVPFVVAFAFAMSRIEPLIGFHPAFQSFFFVSLSFFVLFILVPDRYGPLQPRVLRLIDRDGLELFLSLLASVRHADGAAYERLRSAVASWLPADRAVLHFLLPDRRSVAMLHGLSAFLRLARASGALEVIAGVRGQVEDAVARILTGHAVTVAPGAPPSLLYSALAISVADEAAIGGRLPLPRMLDRVAGMLAERLDSENVNLVGDVVVAARVLRAQQRAIPVTAAVRPFVERSTLTSPPGRGQSLVELCELAELLDDPAQLQRLAPIVRSRMWETLQLNPRKEVHVLLDCYLAAVRLGEGDSPLATAAAVIVSEIAHRTADEHRVRHCERDRSF